MSSQGLALTLFYSRFYGAWLDLRDARAAAENEGGRAKMAMLGGRSSVDTAYHYARSAATYAAGLLPKHEAAS